MRWCCSVHVSLKAFPFRSPSVAFATAASLIEVRRMQVVYPSQGDRVERQIRRSLDARFASFNWLDDQMTFASFFCCGRASDWVKERREHSGSWRVFSLKELRSATNNFNYDNKIGEGGFGSVYWGQLWDGSQIAIKRLKVWSTSEQEFAVEVEILGRVRHKNLLSFRGYCAEVQEHLIVYDYMPNLSLHSHLHGDSSVDNILDWSRRMSIAIGSAEGIAYLHQRATPHIIHQDIKANNVLLDSDFQARVADFGFAKLIPDDATQATMNIKSTRGYLAPEYVTSWKASERSDVYSFGILLLELVSGRRPVLMNLLVTDWALPLARGRKFNEIADPKLNENYLEEELKRMVFVALICAHNRPERRPTMPEVVNLLKGASKEKLATLENDELFRPEPTETSQDKTSEEIIVQETIS
ncbi:hypothetical protein Cni_G09205 [Canna indica]|uniref:Protein kinase domain-containing protein n=1 Tax=Canna indica TaxID=4628 RepID=A0AAQ3K281_9LILI|nr:hypothetical protein Cni_G09205 [Canna indica]